ncbi:hypothetical protein [uncultured Desulfuromusa sp.]|uniref:hypothetical protein n=1 Tax=uncultured Desulfuromusa sp. TaxID=219183 RepID=UPI002AA73009|nr:hypothetical protein [uncultured Desulfuromusa sp.]
MVAAGEVGEIVVKGPQVTRAYLIDPNRPVWPKYPLLMNIIFFIGWGIWGIWISKVECGFVVARAIEW